MPGDACLRTMDMLVFNFLIFINEPILVQPHWRITMTAPKLQNKLEYYKDRSVVDQQSEALASKHFLSSPGDLRRDVKDAIEDHGRWVQAGLVIAAIDCWLDGDANAWDFDNMAMIGYSTSHPIEVNGHVYNFEMSSTAWVSKTAEPMEYCRLTGYPQI